MDASAEDGSESEIGVCETVHAFDFEMGGGDLAERGFAVLVAPADVGGAGPHAVDDAFVGCILRVGECCDGGEVFEDAGVEGFPVF